MVKQTSHRHGTIFAGSLAKGQCLFFISARGRATVKQRRNMKILYDIHLEYEETEWNVDIIIRNMKKWLEWRNPDFSWHLTFIWAWYGRYGFNKNRVWILPQWSGWNYDMDRSLTFWARPYRSLTNVRPPFDSVRLVQITPISLWFYGTQKTLVTGANLNQSSHHWGAPHCMIMLGILRLDFFIFKWTLGWFERYIAGNCIYLAGFSGTCPFQLEPNLRSLCSVLEFQSARCLVTHPATSIVMSNLGNHCCSATNCYPLVNQHFAMEHDNLD